VRLGFRQAANRRVGVVCSLTAPATRRILAAAEDVVQQFADRLTPLPIRTGETALVLPVTSVFEGDHGPVSRHYRDEAVDFGTALFTTRQAKRDFREALARRLGPQFTVMLEKEGQDGEHIHVQVRKGQTYP
jgi:hypothetical protein